MIILKKPIYLLAGLAAMFLVQDASAELVLSFSADNGGTFINDFNVTAGDSLTIGIYAQETNANVELSTEGLVSFGFDLTSAPTTLGSISNATVNPLFDSESHNVITASGFEWEFGETANTGIKGNAVLLGSFQFDTTANGMTLFTVGDRLVGSGLENASWLTPSFSFLDEQIFGAGAANNFQFTINTSSVPEPSSMLLMAAACAGFVSRRHRRV